MARFRRGCALIATAALAGTGVYAMTPIAATAAPVKGGSLTVITQNDIFLSLDPSNNQFASMGQLFFNSIFDNLFYEKLDGSVGKGLVTSYKFTNHSKMFTFSVKPGLTFTDGTPFNAQAVVFNIKRDLAAGCITYGTCDGIFQNVKSITATSRYTVTMKMSAPSPTLAAAFVNDPPDWIGSPTAIKKEGKTGFGQHPIGLGAYEVQSFSSNTKVVLTKNPHYYVKGQPYLDKLTFLNGSVDQSSYAALQSGSAQIVVGITTPSIVTQAKGGFNVKLIASPVAHFLSLNTMAPPFDNILARQAVAYATDQGRIAQLNSPGLGGTVEDTQGPAAYGYQKTVPSFRNFDLAKAKSLVAKVGGLSFSIMGGSTPASQLLLSSMQSTLAQANIKVTLVQASVAETKTALGSGKWTAQLGVLGGVDPVIGPFSFLNYLKSTGVYACCHDQNLNGMIDQLITTPNSNQRLKMIQRVNSYVVAEKQYIVPLYSSPATILASRSVMGLTGAPAVLPVQMPMPLNTMYLK